MNDLVRQDEYDDEDDDYKEETNLLSQPTTDSSSLRELLEIDPKEHSQYQRLKESDVNAFYEKIKKDYPELEIGMVDPNNFEVIDKILYLVVGDEKNELNKKVGGVFFKLSGIQTALRKLPGINNAAETIRDLFSLPDYGLSRRNKNKLESLNQENISSNEITSGQEAEELLETVRNTGTSVKEILTSFEKETQTDLDMREMFRITRELDGYMKSFTTIEENIELHTGKLNEEYKNLKKEKSKLKRIIKYSDNPIEIKETEEQIKK